LLGTGFLKLVFIRKKQKARLFGAPSVRSFSFFLSLLLEYQIAKGKPDIF